MTPHHPRENVRFIDMQAMRYHGHDPNRPVKYGICWKNVIVWGGGIAFSLAVWGGLFLLALWVRG
jgi:hypothetical protein